jgi:ribonuclease HI
MGVGVVIRDHTGGLIAARCATRQFIQEPSVAEALACQTAVALRHQLGLSAAIFEGDSIEVVQAVRKEETSWTIFGPVVEEIKEMLKGGHAWDICHVRRAANEAAHLVAKMAIDHNVNQLWLTTTPPCIRDIVLAESYFSE